MKVLMKVKVEPLKLSSLRLTRDACLTRMEAHSIAPSGDLRKIAKLIASLPEEYSGQTHFD